MTENYLGLVWQNEKRKISELVEWPANPRQITEKQAQDLKRSLVKFGLVDPFVINLDNEIIGGHQRKKILELLIQVDPDYEVDVRVPERMLTREEVRELNIRLNKNAGEWDWDGLANEFGFNELMDWGFRSSELDLNLWPSDEEPAAVEAKVDQGEELREKWGTELGQVWELGDHLLICGDCTDPLVMDRLLGGQKAAMVFTDPPYAIYGSSTGVSASIADDKMILPFFRDIVQISRDRTELYSHIYIFCDWRSYRAWVESLNRCKVPMKNLIVWDKGDGGLGAMFQQCHEFIVFATNDPFHDKVFAKKGEVGRQRKVYGVSNIWRFPRVTGDERQHNAAKPVDLIEKAIEISTDDGDLVLDMFVGSGSTLVACERLKRRCLAVDVDPAMVAVTIQRWVDMTEGRANIVDILNT